jgi:hypothetical protein
MALFSVACDDNLSYDYKMANSAICIDLGDCKDPNSYASEGNYTEDMQWARSYYQTLSLKHVALKKEYISGSLMIGSNGLDFAVSEKNSSNPEYSLLYSNSNFEDALPYGTSVLELTLTVDGEQYYTEQSVTLEDFDYFSPYQVASFSDGAIEKNGLMGGFNVYSNSVVSKDGSSLVTGFNSIVSY